MHYTVSFIALKIFAGSTKNLVFELLYLPNPYYLATWFRWIGVDNRKK